MKFGGTDFSVFLVDGYNLAASLIESASMGIENITQGTNPFGVQSEENTPIGIMKGVLQSTGGLYDIATDALHTALGTVVGISRIVCAAINGNVPGRTFMGFQGAYSQKYEVMDDRGGLTKANVTYVVSGVVEEGQIVQDLATFTADWDTKTGGAGAADTPVDYAAFSGNKSVGIVSNTIANPTVVTTVGAHSLVTGDKILISGVITSSPTINGERTVTVISPTTFSVPVNVTVAGTGGNFVRTNTRAYVSPDNGGGAAYLQVTAFSGFSGVVMKIMHSPDDITYATLVTFTNVTSAPNKQRVAVITAIDRYTSSNGDVTGTGSITVFSGLARTR